MAGPHRLFGLGLVLILAGFLLVALAPILLLTVWHLGGTEAATGIGVGGCVLVLFIPVCFGYASGMAPELPLLAAAVLMLAAAAVAGVLARARAA